MAAKPASAPMPEDDDDGDATGASGADDDTASGDGDSESEWETIGTLLCRKSDGAYGLVQGDENEEGAGEDGSEGSEPEVFNSIGELLKGVMETVKEHETSKSGEGSEADNFDAGYSDDSGPTPKGGQ